ncbi:MAG: hypothetical protein ABJP92_01825, partial [Flavobacteriaceae bacterium]
MAFLFVPYMFFLQQVRVFVLLYTAAAYRNEKEAQKTSEKKNENERKRAKKKKKKKKEIQLEPGSIPVSWLTPLVPQSRFGDK